MNYKSTRQRLSVSQHHNPKNMMMRTPHFTNAFIESDLKERRIEHKQFIPTRQWHEKSCNTRPGNCSEMYRLQQRWKLERMTQWISTSKILWWEFSCWHCKEEEETVYIPNNGSLAQGCCHLLEGLHRCNYLIFTAVHTNAHTEDHYYTQGCSMLINWHNRGLKLKERYAARVCVRVHIFAVWGVRWGSSSGPVTAGESAVLIQRLKRFGWLINWAM